MIAAILALLALASMILLTMYDKIIGFDHSIFCLLEVIFSIFILNTFFVIVGFLPLKHEYTKGQVINALETVPDIGIELAKEWNKDEHRFNNYFFRFSLREEDLVNIDYYISLEAKE